MTHPIYIDINSDYPTYIFADGINKDFNSAVKYFSEVINLNF